MNHESLEPHREFLKLVLLDDEPYSVARIRELAINRAYPALTSLSEALIWNYRAHDFLDEVDHWIDGRPAWSGRHWKNLLESEQKPVLSVWQRIGIRIKHWLEILPYVRRAFITVLSGKAEQENGAGHS